MTTTPHFHAVLAVLLGGLVLSGCSSRVQDTAAGACYKRLEQMHVSFQPAAPVGDESRGCGISNPVTVSSLQSTLSRPAVTSCELAEAMAVFDEQVVQPAALRHFGQRVAKVHHMGTYSCRNRTGGRRDKLSEHAFGRAMDIGGFELANGTRIDIRSHWYGGDARAAFLHEVARNACGRFAVVLTPNHDRYHQDHLHLDVGPYKFCGI